MSRTEAEIVDIAQYLSPELSIDKSVKIGKSDLIDIDCIDQSVEGILHLTRSVVRPVYDLLTVNCLSTVNKFAVGMNSVLIF